MRNVEMEFEHQKKLIELEGEDHFARACLDIEVSTDRATVKRTLVIEYDAHVLPLVGYEAGHHWETNAKRSSVPYWCIWPDCCVRGLGRKQCVLIGGREGESRRGCWLVLAVSRMSKIHKLLGAVDTRRYPRAENRAWSDQEDHEERGSKDRAASTCGPYSDSFNDTSRRRRSNGSTNNFQTSLQKQILNPSALSVHSL
ncbi:hypothetical protein TNCV_2807541 [Trichonephila clavipes]|nr:hypothetical protein TNCV_2807541 [Trichonephila clavipes]